MTTNSADLSPQWAGAFGICDVANTSPSCANSANSSGSSYFVNRQVATGYPISHSPVPFSLMRAPMAR